MLDIIKNEQITFVNTPMIYAKNHIIEALFNEFGEKVSKANCLSLLRQQRIDFLNLGNIVYCPNFKLLIFFKLKILHAYDLIEEFSNKQIMLR